MSRRRVLGRCLFVAVLLVLAGSVAVGGALADDTTGGPTEGDVQIAEAVADAEGEVEVLVGFDGRGVAVSNRNSVGGMQSTAERTQADLATFAAETEGVSVERQFWIANAALVTVDTGQTSMETLAAVDGVERLGGNVRGTATSGTASAAEVEAVGRLLPPAPESEAVGHAQTESREVGDLCDAARADAAHGA